MYFKELTFTFFTLIELLKFQDPTYDPQPEERPGGFQWGQNQENENINENVIENQNHEHQD